MDPLINFLYGPTLNIAGLRSGFLGPETTTIPYIIPDRATATLDWSGHHLFTDQSARWVQVVTEWLQNEPARPPNPRVKFKSPTAARTPNR